MPDCCFRLGTSRSCPPFSSARTLLVREGRDTKGYHGSSRRNAAARTHLTGIHILLNRLFQLAGKVEMHLFSLQLQ